jgi:hypothetical protein
MPNDLSVRAATPGNPGNGAVVPGKPAATAVPIDHVTPTQFASLNPSQQLDAALGIVVLEFRNDTGTITSSIPSQQQLAAYRQWQDVRATSAPQPGAAATDIVPASASSDPPTQASANGHAEDRKV